MDAINLTKRYTYADYLTWIDDKTRELIDGFVHIMSPAPKLIHQRLGTKIVNKIYNLIEKNRGQCEVFYETCVRFPKNEIKNDSIYDVVHPDIIVVCDPSKLDENGCLGAPDLIVEILSDSTLKRDWNYKFNLYEENGVREYWIVDPKAKTCNVFIQQSDFKYDNGTVYDSSQKLPIYIFDGLEINLDDIFK